MSPAKRIVSDPARSTAFTVLFERERNIALPADVLLDRELTREVRLTSRDREFATNLVYTTIRYQLTIDEAIRRRGGRDPSGLDPRTRTILRLGACQIIYSRSVPGWAAVATSVDLARHAGKEQACGLVNAILRNLVRAQEAGEPLVPVDESTPEGIAVATSHPVWLVRRVLAAFGREGGRRFLERNNEPAPPSLRVNIAKTTRERALERLRLAGVGAEPSPWVPDGILLSDPAYLPSLPGFDLGWLVVQDEAAQIVSHVLAPRPGERVLDLCAGLGGKALHLASLLRVGGGGEVVAADVTLAKLVRLREMAGRLGLSNVTILAADGRSGAGLRADTFDRVLVDAPCSDLGGLRRHPDVKWRRREQDIARLARLQGELLSSAARLVRPGGALVYCTCTITEDENDGVVRRFLESREDFRMEDPRPDLPDPCRSLVGEDLCLRTYPAAGGMDGFFSARLRRRNGGQRD